MSGSPSRAHDPLIWSRACFAGGRHGLPEFDCLAPMVGIPWRVLKTVGHLPRSDEAKANGWVVDFDAAKHEI